MGVKDLLETLPYGPAPEAAGPALEWLDAHQRRFGLFIDGAFTEPGEPLTVFNPCTATELAQVTQASQADVDLAVAAAKRAQPEWEAAGGFARAKVLYALARQIQKHSRLFAVLESLDNGKPIRETRDLDIPLVIRHFYYHAGLAQNRDAAFPGAQPVGVCAQIIPWNFPLLMLAWKIAPALAMGNAVVLKPAEYTPLTALLFGEICQHAGVPPGVVNLLTGDGEVGKALVRHPGVDKIAFTGSTEVGRWIRTETAGAGKKLSLELGGKSPYVVFEDADLDSAVEGLVDAIWFNQGQVCCAGSRLLVQESIEDRFLAKVRDRMRNLRIGDPLDKAVDIGAIVAPVQLDRIRALVDQGVREGAEIFQPPCDCPSQGWFYPPTLLSGVAPSATVAQVEIFGPVLVEMSFRTPAEAVALANNTTYGLASSVWTQNIDLALDTADKIKAGTVWINCTNRFDASSGFGGYRESGYGREGGKEGLYEYMIFPPGTFSLEGRGQGSSAVALAKEGEGEPPTLQIPRTVSPTDQPTNLPTYKPTHPPIYQPTNPPTHRRTDLQIDRTHKLFIGGKQVRPDGGYSVVVEGQEFARANRKDVRNAVDAARNVQPAWAALSAHARAQILFYLAENMASELPGKVDANELAATVESVFAIAGWCDKRDGSVHQAPLRGLVYTRDEPVGVVGLVASDQRPLLNLVAPLAGAIAMGNAAVAVASETGPLAAVEFYRVIEMSDVPAGVVAILTGLRSETQPTLADHLDVDAIWDLADSAPDSERRSAANLKQTWSPKQLSVEGILRHAVQVKNVWVPFGV